MVSRFGKSNTPFAFAHSVIGQSHVKAGTPCQDASLCVSTKKYTLAAVADGHGGDQYLRSDTGSRFAVQAARECMTDSAVLHALKTVDKGRESIIAQLKRSIVGRWNTLITEHLNENPFADEELSEIPQKYADRYRAGESPETAYGSTLIAVLWTESFLLVLQIGDGSCIILSDESELSQPVPADEKCFLNMTTSLCDADAVHEIRHYYSANLPAAVLVGTDGIDDCFAGEEKLYSFYRVILSSFLEKDEDVAITELTDYLPRMSEKGSGDDISIGMILDREILRTMELERP